MKRSTFLPPDAAPTYSVRVVRPVATNVATQRDLSLCVGKTAKPILGQLWEQTGVSSGKCILERGPATPREEEFLRGK